MLLETAETRRSDTGRFGNPSPSNLRRSVSTGTRPGSGPVCPVEVDDAQVSPAGLDEDAAQAPTLLERRLRGKPEQAEENHARDP